MDGSSEGETRQVAAEKIPDQNTEREAWLRWRLKHGGGSDAPVLFGESRWKSVLDLYAEKRDGVQESRTARDVEFLEWCLMLEEPIARAYARASGRVLRRRAPLVWPLWPRLSCTLDREVQSIGDRGPGVCEIKSLGPVPFRRVKMNGPDASFVIQTTHNMMVRGVRWGVIVAASRDTGEREAWDFEFDLGLAEEIERRWRAFFALVDREERATEAELWAIVGKSPTVEKAKDDAGATGYVAKLDAAEHPEVAEMVRAVVEAKEVAADVADLESTAKARLAGVMAGIPADVIEIDGWRVYNAEQAGRESFDKKALAKAHPEIDLSVFTKRGASFRSMRLYPIKGE